MRVKVTVNEHDRDLLPPQLRERRVVIDGKLRDGHRIGLLVGEIGENVVDHAPRDIAQVASVPADESHCRHAAIVRRRRSSEPPVFLAPRFGYTRCAP